MAATPEALENWPIAQAIQTGLEIAGFDMTNFGAEHRARHTLLMPRGLRIDVDGEHTWDSIELVDIEPEATKRCLWDFIELVDASAEKLSQFASKWGLFNFGQDAGYMVTDSEAWGSPIDWDPTPRQAVNWLLALDATETGELVREEVLEALRLGDDYKPNVIAEFMEEKKRLPSSVEIHDAELERYGEHWRAERAAGRGMALQAGMVLTLLRSWTYPVELVPRWDAGERRLEAVARGVKEIVGAHLGRIFAAPQLDVFVCSVCGKPYPLREGQRRPRAGVRRLCSPACRKAAKQAGNRASWHRNKEEWLSKKRRRQ